MALVFFNQGESIALSLLVNKTGTYTQRNLILRLFKSNTTPSETDTEATYTEADFTGYSAITLTGTSWSLTPGAPSNVAYAQQTFTSSAGSQSQNVYGYYYTQATDGFAPCAERFSDGPYGIVNNGDAIKVTPTITAD
jgi:hypothetical protein